MKRLALIMMSILCIMLTGCQKTEWWKDISRIELHIRDEESIQKEIVATLDDTDKMYHLYFTYRHENRGYSPNVWMTIDGKRVGFVEIATLRRLNPLTGKYEQSSNPTRKGQYYISYRYYSEVDFHKRSYFGGYILYIEII